MNNVKNIIHFNSFFCDNMFMQWINKKQHICFDIDELFAWQDALDEIEKTPEKAWDLFDDFLWEAEDQLEFSEDFLKELEEIAKDVDKREWIPLNL